MKILIDIVHPADVLFFKRPLETWQSRGDDTLILSREKDVTHELLNQFGFEHKPISRAGRGLHGLAFEMLHRDWAVLRHARRFRPDVMIGFGGVSISHVGKFLGIPSVAFYDSENATLQTRLTFPFIAQLYVPQSYAGATPSGRTVRLCGTKELSYLHPRAFVPNKETAMAAGLDNERDNFLIRVVEWRANHDIAKGGWDAETLSAVVEFLGQRGRVHISSERRLPADLDALRFRGRISDIHHLMAHCRLLVGESATMAAEAAILGVPAIYAGRDFPGYVLELAQAGLVRNIDVRTPESARSKILQAVASLLDHLPERTAELCRKYVDDCTDWAEAVVAAVDRAGRTA